MFDFEDNQFAHIYLKTNSKSYYTNDWAYNSQGVYVKQPYMRIFVPWSNIDRIVQEHPGA